MAVTEKEVLYSSVSALSIKVNRPNWTKWTLFIIHYDIQEYFLEKLELFQSSSGYEITDYRTICSQKWFIKKTAGCGMGSMSSAKIRIS